MTDTYAVRLVKRADDAAHLFSAWSDEVSVTIPAITNSYPAVPTGVTVTEVLHETDPAKGTLSWTAVAGATSYTVLRALWVRGVTGDYTTLSSAFSGASYDDTTIEAGKTYVYRVKATNSVGASPVSRIAILNTSSLMYGIPDPVKGLAITYDDTTQRATVTWAPPSGATFLPVTESLSPSLMRKPTICWKLLGVGTGR